MTQEANRGSGRVSHSETCLFWRCLRRVLNEGNPASGNLLVEVPVRGGGTYPLLIMTLTRANRLICWPVLPSGLGAPAEDRGSVLIDHVTLDLNSRRSHSTAYNPRGGARHPAKWKIHPFPANGVSFWFGLAVRLSTVEHQVLERHQDLRWPTSHATSRTDQFRLFFDKLQRIEVNVPVDHEASADALIALVYLVDRTGVTLTDDLLQPLKNGWPDDVWDERPEGKVLNVISTALVVDSVQLGLLLTFPPCNLREEGPFLFAPSMSKAKSVEAR